MILARLCVVFLLVGLILGLPALASGPDILADGGQAKVSTVVDGDTVVLDDGREVRMVGIQAPKLPLGRPNFPTWPLGPEAKVALERMVLGRSVNVHLAPMPEDRHGRVLAHLTRTDDSLWLQGELLKQGLARVYTFPDNRVLAKELLGFERRARRDAIGMWALSHYDLRTVKNVNRDIGSFQIVEGLVWDTAKVKKNIYLNFGADWRSDFTIQVRVRDEPLFQAAGIDLMALKGKRVRVRGWVKAKNGPLIELDHPERLELPDNRNISEIR